MAHITADIKDNNGRVALIECLKDNKLNNIQIKNECFLLIFLTSGLLKFRVCEKTITATAPCFICFNETENPALISKLKAEYYCVYFHPKFLNINMTFDFLRSKNYSDIATIHDMFLLKPFIDDCHVIPVCENYHATIETACIFMEQELREQRDWYWSCRGRSYFMEVIIALERMYGLIIHGEGDKYTDSTPNIKNPKLRDAILFIEGHYMQNLTLSDISNAAGINHTTLTKLLKEEMGLTAMEYLAQYRIKVAKKQLAFTEVPIKDIAIRCGFTTVQHFNRVFKQHTESTPANFRKSSVKKRKDEIKPNSVISLHF